MAKKIEILENTLLKLLVRRGDDADRQNITLSEGELGYTIDSKRLFVGDGSTLGGLITGNKFLGSVADHTSLTEGAEGDIAYNTTNNILYVKTASGWDKIAQIFEAANDSIIINDTLGTIAVGTLSSQHLSGSNEITGNSIELVSGQISLSSTQIKTNRVTAYNTEYLTLPQKLNINSVDYTFPTGGLGGANSFLKADASGNLQWAAPEANATVYFNSSSVIPVGTIIPVASGSSVPSGYLLCNGQSIAGADYRDLSAVIGSQYGGDDTNFNLPDYEDSVLYGVNSNPVGGTEYHLDTGTSGLSAKAVTFFIKALPDTVATPSFTLSGNLQASTNGTAVTEGESFDPFEDNVVISTPVPGVDYNHYTSGSGTFDTKATYTKFWVTGSGQKGGSRAGGSSATVYGILSAPIGTTVDFFVGAGVTTTNTSGNDSYISIGGTELARSEGARYRPSSTALTPSLTGNGGSIILSDDHVLGGYVLSGAIGGLDVSGSDEESVGAASFWGGHGAPGAGSVGTNSVATDTSNGLVKFEWGV